MDQTRWAKVAVSSRRACRLIDPQVAIIIIVAVIVEVGLRYSTLPRLTWLLGVRLAQNPETQEEPDPAPPPDLPVSWIHRRAVAVNRVFRHWPFDNTCLRRALVLGQRIRRLDPALVIGVRLDDTGTLAAHAWIAVAGVALDSLATQYAPLGPPPQG
jgi:hypothetical protein